MASQLSHSLFCFKTEQTMAVSSLSLSLTPTFSSTRGNLLPRQSNQPKFIRFNVITCSTTINTSIDEEQGDLKRRPILLGLGALSLSLLPINSVFAEEIPAKYDAFVDKEDGYSYYYPSDWVGFDFRAHDSAFKDRYLQLQNVRVSFIPTEKSDVHELGPMEEVVTHLVRHVFATPTQIGNIFDMQERTIDGKNYYTFEYALTSRNFSRAAFATIAVANGRYYTLIVGANERRWRRFRNQLKVVADSFKVLDI